MSISYCKLLENSLKELESCYENMTDDSDTWELSEEEMVLRSKIIRMSRRLAIRFTETVFIDPKERIQL